MRIGELAAAVGVSPATIRFYGRSGVVAVPARTGRGYRDRSAQAVEEIRFVRAGRAIGLTLLELAGIAAFRERGEELCTELIALMERRLGEADGRIRELTELRAQLVDLVVAAGALDLILPPTYAGSLRPDNVVPGKTDTALAPEGQISENCPPNVMYDLLEPKR